MYIEQFYLGCLAQASYAVLDGRTKRVVIIDPRRDVEPYLEFAESHGARIDAVVLTHFHADFIAGHLELRDRVGARIHLGARAKADYEFTPLASGDRIEFGGVRLEVLETPGHTPEAISLVAYDLERDPSKPVAVFTGDTLFVGDVGRPDLLASVGVTSDELAGWLYDSLREQLMPLPDDTLVYPAHGAGSLCGKNLGSETFSTIGEQRRNNYALQPMTKAEFKAIVTAEQPAAPRYFVHDATMNKTEFGGLAASLSDAGRALSPAEVSALRAGGARVLDTRSPAEFAAGHLAGSLSVGLDGRFATWAGSLLSPDDEVVVIAPEGREREAAVRLGRVGLDGVVGHLAGGARAIGDDAVTVPNVEPSALAAELGGAASAPVVLDVRNPGEYDAGHIEGAIGIPLGQLPDRLNDVPRDRGIAVVCKSGYRSTAAISVLLGAGIGRLRNVEGGMDAWTAAALPIAAPHGGACGS